MRFILCPLILFYLAISCNNKSGETTPVNESIEKYDPLKDSSVYTGEMKQYWLVLLKKGPNRNQDSSSAEKIQAGHMANINRLAKEGKLIMAGPIGTEDDLRGIFLMNCKDSAEIAQLVNTDTAVITGRLRMEFYPWWTMKGKYVFK